MAGACAAAEVAAGAVGPAGRRRTRAGGRPRVWRSLLTSRRGWIGIVGSGSAGAFALPSRGSAGASASTADIRLNRAPRHWLLQHPQPEEVQSTVAPRVSVLGWPGGLSRNPSIGAESELTHAMGRRGMMPWSRNGNHRTVIGSPTANWGVPFLFLRVPASLRDRPFCMGPTEGGRRPEIGTAGFGVTHGLHRQSPPALLPLESKMDEKVVRPLGV